MDPRTDNGHARVLVADDDRDILTLVVEMLRLREPNCEVVTAADGEQALRLALSLRPNVAVLDVNMPSLTSLEVVRAIRESETAASMPVLLLSANAKETDRTRGLEAGANEYMKKPFSPPELLTQIRAALQA